MEKTLKFLNNLVMFVSLVMFAYYFENKQTNEMILTGVMLIILTIEYYFKLLKQLLIDDEE